MRFDSSRAREVASVILEFLGHARSDLSHPPGAHGWPAKSAGEALVAPTTVFSLVDIGVCRATTPLSGSKLREH